MLKVWLNEKVVDVTEPDKTQKKCWFTMCFFFFLISCEGIQPMFHQAVYHGIFTVLYSFFFKLCFCSCVTLEL